MFSLIPLDALQFMVGVHLLQSVDWLTVIVVSLGVLALGSHH
jgi:hypothetical protein